jgi:hypothetical protein
MRSILTILRNTSWLRAPWDDAKSLQLPDKAFKIVATGDKNDGFISANDACRTTFWGCTLDDPALA